MADSQFDSLFHQVKHTLLMTDVDKVSQSSDDNGDVNDRLLLADGALTMGRGKTF